MRPEVVVRFSSGLGNQLFQLACGVSLAARLGLGWAGDTTWYDLVARIHRPVRSFRLHKFSFVQNEAFGGPQRQLVGLLAAVFDRWGYGRFALEAVGGLSLVQENRTLTRQALDLVASEKRFYLNGYWQTADHYVNVRDKLRDMLVPKGTLSAGAEMWLETIRQRKTGFIHVRRGDYLNVNGDAGVLPIDYYRRALKSLGPSGDTNIQWLIFSEDIHWAQHHFSFLKDWKVVEYESQDRDIEDLQLMAACDAAIIANSSYSWWGAALGNRPDRAVIAPDQYWNKLESSLRDWVLPGWIQVQAWE